MAFDNRTGDLWTVGDPSSLSVIQLSDGTLVATNASLPNGPVAVAYDWEDNRMFVATRYTATLCIYNATSFQPVSSPIALNFTPSSLFYDGNGDRLFVGDMSGDLLHVFGAHYDTFTSTSWPVGGYPTSMTLDPIHDWLYIANSGGSNVSVVNLTSNRAVGTGVSTGPGPSGLTYNSGAGAIIVTPGGFSDSNLTVIPASGNISFPGVQGIACSFCGGPVAYSPRPVVSSCCRREPRGASRPRTWRCWTLLPQTLPALTSRLRSVSRPRHTIPRTESCSWWTPPARTEAETRVGIHPTLRARAPS